MSHPNYEDEIAFAKGAVKARSDVVTIAKAVRDGDIGLNVQPVSNGFIVTVGYEATVVCTRPNDVGLLIRTLYSSDLENEAALKRLRRLMGYM